MCACVLYLSEGVGFAQAARFWQRPYNDAHMSYIENRSVQEALVCTIQNYISKRLVTAHRWYALKLKYSYI